MSSAQSTSLQVQDGISYVKEIQAMMHGFGDVQEPLTASAQLIEYILLQQMRLLWHEVCSLAEMQESNKVTIEHFVFILRRDPVKIHRFLKYLKRKELGIALSNMTVIDSTFSNLESENKNPAAKRLKRCVDYIVSLDPCFEFIENAVDSVEEQRKLRADLLTRNVDVNKYKEYVKARQISFGHGKFFTSYNSKFREWLTKIDCQNGLSNDVCDVMAYLAYELVGQIVDLSLLVKEDGSGHHDDIGRDYNISSFMTGRVLTNKQMESKTPITPSEIREAMRRYANVQNTPGQLFVRENAKSSSVLMCS